MSNREYKENTNKYYSEIKGVYFMKDVVIVGAARTAIGAFQGSLKDVSAIDLGVAALKGALDRAGIEAAQIDETVGGNVLPAGSPGNVVRHIAIKAGVPVESPAMTVNQQCPSSMRATEIAAQQIMLGKTEISAVVGTENMS